MTLTPPFPSPLERIAASALLLFSASLSASELPADAGDAMVDASPSDSLSLESVDSKSCSSSLISSDEIRAPKLRIVAVQARRHESKLQVGKRLQLNKTWSFNHQKSNLDETFAKSSGLESEQTVSCLSSGSSTDSSVRTQKVREAKKAIAHGGQSVEKPAGSARIRRRAEGILKFLGHGSASEVKIRQALGDSPDTSKALRLLLKREEVTRSGRGGRHHPYIYAIAKRSSDSLQANYGLRTQVHSDVGRTRISKSSKYRVSKKWFHSSVAR